jgi:hypothetical protein
VATTSSVSKFQPILQLITPLAGDNQRLYEALITISGMLQYLYESKTQTPTITAGSGLETTYTLTLSSPTTNITSPISPIPNGAMLSVFLIQSASGGNQITWSSDFKFATVDISVAPNSVSIFRFVGKDGKWWLTGLPLTGML